jgi:hypothetical protein
MSVVGANSAIVSIGMGAQTAHQIRANTELLKSISGDSTLQPADMPFDMVKCTPSSVMQMMFDDKFAPTADDLRFNVKPWWRGANTYYWLEYGDAADLAAARQKSAAATIEFEKRAKAIRALRGSDKHIVLIASNTQNNLDYAAQITKTLNPFVHGAELFLLHAAAKSFFRKQVELIFITYASRYDGANVPGVRTVEIEPDSSPWAGDTERWAQALKKLTT